NNDGDFLDAGEAGYSVGHLSGLDVAWFTLPQLPTTGTYHVQATVDNTAGNTTTSGSTPITVSPTSSPWTPAAQAGRREPEEETFEEVLGDASFSEDVEISDSPMGEDCGCGEAELKYRSSSVTDTPFVQVSIPSSNSGALPANFSERLTFNGVAGATVTY